MATTEESVRLFRIRKNVLEMLKDRGYLVLDSEIDIDYKQFKEKFEHPIKHDDLAIEKHRKDDTSDRILVFFSGEPKVTVKILRHYIDRMKEADVKNAILIVRQALNAVSKKLLLEFTLYNLEVFQEAEMVVNISKHELVPEHQVLTKEEKAKLLERYRVKETQLPRMQFNDPMARYHGLKRGQVVKIIRNSETAGKYITYRYVV